MDCLPWQTPIVVHTNLNVCIITLYFAKCFRNGHQAVIKRNIVLEARFFLSNYAFHAMPLMIYTIWIKLCKYFANFMHCNNYWSYVLQCTSLITSGFNQITLRNKQSLSNTMQISHKFLTKTQKLRTAQTCGNLHKSKQQNVATLFGRCMLEGCVAHLHRSPLTLRGLVNCQGCPDHIYKNIITAGVKYENALINSKAQNSL